MSSLNKVFLMGNLTRDPELRQTPGGASVCTFGIAVNRRYKTSQGEDREETCFVDIETWGRQAETCHQHLRKGAPALVEGRLQQDRWEDKETGQARSRLLVRALQVQFLSTFSGPDRERPGSRGAEPGSTGGNQAGNEPDMPDFEPIDSSEDDIPF
ncbi:MAG: single-stranded DNA-binding protein [Candidatus Pacebacteria bacterium]|nr:single-stranded DNA-binding protein [Candidatus Paceibacterota bacterium]